MVETDTDGAGSGVSDVVRLFLVSTNDGVAGAVGSEELSCVGAKAFVNVTPSAVIATFTASSTESSPVRSALNADVIGSKAAASAPAAVITGASTDLSASTIFLISADVAFAFSFVTSVMSS